MPCRTALTFGATPAMRSLISSSPLTMYLSLHGVPVFVALKQFARISEKPMSLPPIVRLTAAVFVSRACNCGGGLGPGEIDWDDVKSLVTAPLHVTSRKTGTSKVDSVTRG